MKILIQLFGGRGRGSQKIYLHYGKQGKHWEWHNNFDKNRSRISISPEKLKQLVQKFSSTNHGQREVIDFGEIIGQWAHEGQLYDTTNGIIHWSLDGGYHVVPAPPNWWEFK